MRSIRIVCAILVMNILVFTSAFAAESGWKKIGESDGIVGYTRPNPQTPVDEVRAVGMIDAPAAVVEAVIRDVPAKTEYMYNCTEARVVASPELPNSADVIHTYTVTHMPAPVKDRDVVTRTAYTIDKATGTIYSHSVSVDTEYGRSPKRVRMPLARMDYTITPKGPDKCEFTYQGFGHPGGNLPVFVVNTLTKNMGIKTIAGIRKMVKKDKYRVVKTVVTVSAR